MTEFLRLVKEMRDAQKAYFAKRERDILQRCKYLEKQVDKYIKAHENPDMFGGE